MQIPQQFKEAIKGFFYDKKIAILEIITTKDNVGASNSDIVETDNIFYGNVNYSISKEIQKEYGLDEIIDIVITTDYSLIKKGEVISFEDNYYYITDVKPRDSHYRLIGVKYGN